MNLSSLQDLLPDLDPQFVDILEALPEPPSEDLEKVAKVLIQLHTLFLRKRELLKREDKDAWEEILKQETALLVQLN